MSPEEKKAKELIEKFSFCITTHKGTSIIGKELAKECALICVDEIANLLPNINETLPNSRKSDENYFNYWNAVEQEIEKLKL